MNHAWKTQTMHSASSLPSFKGKRPLGKTMEIYVWPYLAGGSKSKCLIIGHFTDFHRR
jgi:hypothetical protein